MAHAKDARLRFFQGARMSRAGKYILRASVILSNRNFFSVRLFAQKLNEQSVLHAFLREPCFT